LIREGAGLGANSTIRCGVTIGKWALIGAGSVVTKDVPDYGLVYGNPARLRGFVDAHGHRIEKIGEEDLFIVAKNAQCAETVRIPKKEWELIK
jgi:serine acetyltransferase